MTDTTDTTPTPPPSRRPVENLRPGTGYTGDPITPERAAEQITRRQIPTDITTDTKPTRRGQATRPAQVVRPHRVDALGTRPAWHTRHTPEPVTAAWNEVTDALDRLTQLEDDWQRATAAAHAADRAYRSGVAAAERDRTKAPNPPKPATDPAELLIRYAAAWQVCREKRRHYDAQVAEHLDLWRTAFADDFAAAQPRARQAWSEFTAAWSDWWTLVALLADLETQLDPDFTGPPNTGETRRRRDLARKAINQLGEIVGSNDPDLTGAWLTEPRIEPPHWLRRHWLHDAGPAGWDQLRKVERQERDQGVTPTTTYLVDTDGRDLDVRTGRPVRRHSDKNPHLTRGGSFL